MTTDRPNDNEQHGDYDCCFYPIETGFKTEKPHTGPMTVPCDESREAHRRRSDLKDHPFTEASQTGGDVAEALRSMLWDFVHFVQDDVVWDDDMPKVDELVSKAETVLHDTNPAALAASDAPKCDNAEHIEYKMIPTCTGCGRIKTDVLPTTHRPRAVTPPTKQRCDHPDHPESCSCHEGPVEQRCDRKQEKPWRRCKAALDGSNYCESHAGKFQLPTDSEVK